MLEMRSLAHTGTETEGVFRLSANAAVVDELVGRFDRGESVDFDASVIFPSSSGKPPALIDAHVVAALLKRWFRELPEPLCTTEMYDMWIAAASIRDEPTKLQQVKKVLSFLPLSNQILVKYLAAFLRAFAVFADDTKMPSKNLSICFAPNLLRAPDSIGLADQMEESPIATGLLVMFIENFDNVFDGTVGIAAPFAEGPLPTAKPSLTANLLPPPPVASSPVKSGPAPPPNKPSPKFAPKKTGFRLNHSREASNDSTHSTSSPLSLSGGSNLAKSSSGSLQTSPDASVPSPIQTVPVEAGISALSLPPPPVAPKPNKSQLKRSTTNSKKGSEDADSGALSPRDASPSRTPPPPPLGDPTELSSSISPASSYGTPSPLTSSAPKGLPPPRPSSNPNFV